MKVFYAIIRALGQVFRQPALVLCGQHDELTPACSMKLHAALPNSQIRVFPNSSHTPMYEESDIYFEKLLEFLGKHRG